MNALLCNLLWKPKEFVQSFEVLGALELFFEFASKFRGGLDVMIRILPEKVLQKVAVGVDILIAHIPIFSL